MKTLFNFMMLFFALASISCEPGEVGPVTGPLESKILVQPLEEFKNGKRNLILRSYTEKIFPCINYSLQAKEVVTDRSFKITYTGVEESNMCFTALGPATNEINLGAVPNGDYYIELNSGSVKNKGLLSVTSKEIELVFAQLNGIEILSTEVKRVPE